MDVQQCWCHFHQRQYWKRHRHGRRDSGPDSDLGAGVRHRDSHSDRGRFDRDRGHSPTVHATRGTTSASDRTSSGADATTCGDRQLLRRDLAGPYLRRHLVRTWRIGLACHSNRACNCRCHIGINDDRQCQVGGRYRHNNSDRWTGHCAWNQYSADRPRCDSRHDGELLGSCNILQQSYSCANSRNVALQQSGSRDHRRKCCDGCSSRFDYDHDNCRIHHSKHDSDGDRRHPECSLHHSDPSFGGRGTEPSAESARHLFRWHKCGPHVERRLAVRNARRRLGGSAHWTRHRPQREPCSGNHCHLANLRWWGHDERSRHYERRRHRAGTSVHRHHANQRLSYQQRTNRTVEGHWNALRRHYSRSDLDRILGLLSAGGCDRQ